MPTYVVQPGDTLSAIARRLGLRSYRELTGYRSGNPNLIFPGEVLSYASPAPGASLAGQGTAREGQHSGSVSTSPPPAPDQNNLRIVARDGTWLVFNRDTFRSEVVDYLWGGALNPTANELHSRSGVGQTSTGAQLELPDTHWALAQTAFAARPDLYQRLRPSVRRLMESLRDQSTHRPPPRPSWIPETVWLQILSATAGVHRYPRSSPLGTAIIVLKRDDGRFGAYVEAPTDEPTLFRLVDATEPSLLRRLVGAESSRQASVRWLATANLGYNAFMLREVNRGVQPGDALRNYLYAVHTRWLLAFVPLIQSGGGISFPR